MVRNRLKNKTIDRGPGAGGEGAESSDNRPLTTAKLPAHLKEVTKDTYSQVSSSSIGMEGAVKVLDSLKEEALEIKRSSPIPSSGAEGAAKPFKGVNDASWRLSVTPSGGVEESAKLLVPHQGAIEARRGHWLSQVVGQKDLQSSRGCPRG